MSAIDPDDRFRANPVGRYPRAMGALTVVLWLLPMTWGYLIVAGIKVSSVCWLLGFGELPGPEGGEGVARVMQSTPESLVLLCAGYGLVAMWTALTPRVLRGVVPQRLAGWQRVGLVAGVAVSALTLVLSAVGLGSVGRLNPLTVYFLGGVAWLAYVALQLLREARAP